MTFTLPVSCSNSHHWVNLWLNRNSRAANNNIKKIHVLQVTIKTIKQSEIWKLHFVAASTMDSHWYSTIQILVTAILLKDSFSMSNRAKKTEHKPVYISIWRLILTIYCSTGLFSVQILSHYYLYYCWGPWPCHKLKSSSALFTHTFFFLPLINPCQILPFTWLLVRKDLTRSSLVYSLSSNSEETGCTHSLGYY